MAIEIKSPTFPESIADGTVATWHKKVGDSVKRDELLVDIETDKVVLEVTATSDGVLVECLKNEGDIVSSDEIIGLIDPQSSSGKSSTSAQAPKTADSKTPKTSVSESSSNPTIIKDDTILSPSARKLASEKGILVSELKGTGKDGRVTKADVANTDLPQHSSNTPVNTKQGSAILDIEGGERVEKRVPMTRLRAKIAERLVEAQSSMAMLTTFNEINMKPVMDLRSKYKDLFEKTHGGTRLGFMSFFVKASTEALKRFPAVNASIDSGDVVYHGYQDIGVAVSSDRGLVVPILRNCEYMGLSDIESKISEFGKKAKDGKLTMDDIQGGTFTISNGGVFGSLLSTPIVNPPQAAILGMHKIQERPMAVNGQVVILPMMYLALSYDHRLIDGKEAVSFLVTIKDLLEDPARMLLEV